ncbi:MAG: hypothetical protein D6711_11935, partial [Chloroflexi bacterium]
IAATATAGIRDPEALKEGRIAAKPIESKFLGDIKPLTTGLAEGVSKATESIKEGKALKGAAQLAGGVARSAADTVGTGLEIASIAAGGKPELQAARELVSEGGKVAGKEALKQFLKTETGAGALGGFGIGLQEAANDPTNAIGKVAGATALGGITGGVFSLGNSIGTKAARGILKKVKNRIDPTGTLRELKPKDIDLVETQIKNIATSQGKTGARMVEELKNTNPRAIRTGVEIGAIPEIDSKLGLNTELARRRVSNVIEDLAKSRDEILKKGEKKFDAKVIKSIILSKVADANPDITDATLSKIVKKLDKKILDEEKVTLVQLTKDIKRTLGDEARAAIGAPKKVKNFESEELRKALKETIEELSGDNSIKEINSVISDLTKYHDFLFKLGTGGIRKSSLGRFVGQVAGGLLLSAVPFIGPFTGA